MAIKVAWTRQNLPSNKPTRQQLPRPVGKACRGVGKDPGGS